MTKRTFTTLACAAMTLCLCSSCDLKETLKKWINEKENTVEATTDSIKDVKVENTEAVSATDDAVTDAEAIAFIEEFYAMDGWEVSDLQKYLSPETLKDYELTPEESGIDDVAIGGKYKGWELVCVDPVGDLDQLNVTKAVPVGDGRYKKIFTTAHWADHSHKYNTTYYYTVKRIDGQLKIAKVEYEYGK